MAAWEGNSECSLHICERVSHLLLGPLVLQPASLTRPQHRLGLGFPCPLVTVRNSRMAGLCPLLPKTQPTKDWVWQPRTEDLGVRGWDGQC